MKVLSAKSLAVIAYAVPVTTYIVIRADTAAQVEKYGWACGTSTAMLAIVACVVSGCLSFSATATYLRGSTWRIQFSGPKHMLRLLGMALPFATAAALGVLMLAGWLAASFLP